MTLKQFFDTLNPQGEVNIMYESITLFGQHEINYVNIKDKYKLREFLRQYGDIKVKYIRGSAKGLEICLT